MVSYKKQVIINACNDLIKYLNTEFPDDSNDSTQEQRNYLGNLLVCIGDSVLTFVNFPVNRFTEYRVPFF